MTVSSCGQQVKRFCVEKMRSADDEIIHMLDNVESRVDGSRIST